MQEVEAALGIESDYQALTPREENDLESLMSQCDFAISNAEKFSEQLAGDLSVLDGVSFLIFIAEAGVFRVKTPTNILSKAYLESFFSIS